MVITIEEAKRPHFVDQNFGIWRRGRERERGEEIDFISFLAEPRRNQNTFDYLFIFVFFPLQKRSRASNDVEMDEMNQHEINVRQQERQYQQEMDLFLQLSSRLPREICVAIIAARNQSRYIMDLRKHSRWVPIQKYECTFCGMKFKDQAMHIFHMAHHGNIDPFECNLCGTRCQDMLSFNLHMNQSYNH